MAPKSLFGNEEGEVHLRINEAFAKKFEARKDREEMRKLMKDPKLRARVTKKSELSDGSTEDSDEEDEDSDAELLTHEVEAKILETISRIRMGRKEIYDPNHQFFDQSDFEAKTKTTKSAEGPLTFTKFMRSTLKEVSWDRSRE